MRTKENKGKYKHVTLNHGVEGSIPSEPTENQDVANTCNQ